jgi:hypothetical protein
LKSAFPWLISGLSFANPRPIVLEYALQSLAPMPNLEAITGALALLAMVNGGTAHGESWAAPPLFGVDLGTSADDFAALMKEKSIPCRVAQQGAMICPTGLTSLANLAGTSTTYWIVNGRISRIYQVGDMASLGLANYPALVAFFKERQARIQAFLGDVSARVTGREPAWVAGLDDDSKLGSLRAGTFGCEVVWAGGGRKVSLTLRGEQGKVLLVLGLEATPAQTALQATQSPPSLANAPTKGCRSADVAVWMMDLFPPAVPATRTAAATSLAACKIERSSGALAVALASDEDESVRSASVGALATLGHTKPLRDVLDDAGESDRLRAEALHALVSRGEVPDPEQRRHLSKGAGAQLALALDEISAPPPKPAAPPTLPTRVQPSLPTKTSYTPIAASEPEAPVPAPEPAVPPPPPKPSDGAALAITTSTLAGGLWGAGLSKLALQDSVGFITLAGSAGAIIGGGTALGLVHFGKTPTPEQALFFTNTTAWGSLAGLMAWAGSGSDNAKLK